jgi:hypothetical protein
MKNLLLFLVSALPVFAGYNYYVPVTVKHGMVSTTLGNNNLTNFAVYVKLSGAQFKSGGHIANSVSNVNGQTVPADLIFATSPACSTTTGAWEVASWDQTNGIIEAWVLNPSLSYSTDWSMYACYGNSSVTTFQGGSVGGAWDSYFKGVYHFGTATSLSLNDSTSNAKTLTHPGSAIEVGLGFAGGALTHETAGDPVTITTSVPGYPLTIESWYYPTNYSNNPVLLALTAQSSWSSYFDTSNSSTTAGQVSAGCDAGTAYSLAGPTWTSAANNTWHHVAAVYPSATSWSLIVDGVVYGPNTTSCAPSFDHLDVGNLDYGNGNVYNTLFYDDLDEVRVSNTARSNDWIITEYNNIANQATYVIAGSEQTNLPQITSISPTSTAAPAAQFTLTVNGTTLISGSTVYWNSTALTTTWVSNTQLTAIVPTTLTTSQETATITVQSSYGTGNPASFAILGPAISSFSPASAVAGGAQFSVTVNGSNFISGDAVVWNSTPLTTTYVNSTQLTAVVTAGLIASATTASITVTGTSGTAAAASYSVFAPTITGLSPDWAGAGGSGFTLTVNGAGFAPGATVYWGATALATSFVNSGQLSATVSSTQIATYGAYNVTVQDSAGTSPAAAFMVGSNVPTMIFTPSLITTLKTRAAANTTEFQNLLGQTYLYQGCNYNLQFTPGTPDGLPPIYASMESLTNGRGNGNIGYSWAGTNTDDYEASASSQGAQNTSVCYLTLAGGGVSVSGWNYTWNGLSITPQQYGLLAGMQAVKFLNKFTPQMARVTPATPPADWHGLAWRPVNGIFNGEQGRGNMWRSFTGSGVNQVQGSVDVFAPSWPTYAATSSGATLYTLITNSIYTAGNQVLGPNIPAGTTVTAVNSTVTLSKNVTSSISSGATITDSTQSNWCNTTAVTNSGSNVLTIADGNCNGGLIPFKIGDTVTGAGIPAGTTVTGLPSITISANVTGTVPSGAILTSLAPSACPTGQGQIYVSMSVSSDMTNNMPITITGVAGPLASTVNGNTYYVNGPSMGYFGFLIDSDPNGTPACAVPSQGIDWAGSVVGSGMNYNDDQQEDNEYADRNFMTTMAEVYDWIRPLHSYSVAGALNYLASEIAATSGGPAIVANFVTGLPLTDLTIDASNNKKVTSASHSFVSGDVGKSISVTNGANWTLGTYTIASVSSGAAILNNSPTAAGNANQAVWGWTWNASTNPWTDSTATTPGNYPQAIPSSYTTLRAQVLDAMDAWTREQLIAYYSGNDVDTFNVTASNYHWGHYAGLGLTGIAAYYDDPRAAVWYDYWRNHMHLGIDQPFAARWFGPNGNMMDSYNYQGLADANVGVTLLSNITAMGDDLISNSAQPFNWIQGIQYYQQNLEPNGREMLQRGNVFNFSNTVPPCVNCTGPNFIVQYLADIENNPLANEYRSFNAQMISQWGEGGPGWGPFALWNPSGTQTPWGSGTPLVLGNMANAAGGYGHVYMRSDWTTGAIYASFRAGPVVFDEGNGHDQYDHQGSIMLQRGTNTLLVHPDAECLRNYPASAAGAGAAMLANAERCNGADLDWGGGVYTVSLTLGNPSTTNSPDSVTLTTSAATTSGATLTFTSTSGVVPGMIALGTNLPTGSSPAGSQWNSGPFVLSVTPTTVTIDENVTGAVPSGSQILFATLGTAFQNNRWSQYINSTYLPPGIGGPPIMTGPDSPYTPGVSYTVTANSSTLQLTTSSLTTGWGNGTLATFSWATGATPPTYYNSGSSGATSSLTHGVLYLIVNWNGTGCGASCATFDLAVAPTNPGYGGSYPTAGTALVFATTGSGSQWMQAGNGSTYAESHPARIDLLESTSNYGYARGVGLEADYGNSYTTDQLPYYISVLGYQREVLYLTPKVFLVYDRTRNPHYNQQSWSFTGFTSGTSSTPAIVTFSGGHGFHSGAQVVLSGCTPVNGTYIVTALDPYNIALNGTGVISGSSCSGTATGNIWGHQVVPWHTSAKPHEVTTSGQATAGMRQWYVYTPTVNIASISDGVPATVTTATPHFLNNNFTVNFAGITGPWSVLNGTTAMVTVPNTGTASDLTTFTLGNTAAYGLSAGGASGTIQKFNGAITTVKPATPPMNLVDLMYAVNQPTAGGFIYRLETHDPRNCTSNPTWCAATGAPTEDSQNWLTVLDASLNAADTAALMPLTATNADMVEVGTGTVAGFQNAPITAANCANNTCTPPAPVLPISYSFTQGPGTVNHYLAGLVPGATYYVNTRTAGCVTISSTGSLGAIAASANGVLSFATTSGGMAALGTTVSGPIKITGPIAWQ